LFHQLRVTGAEEEEFPPVPAEELAVEPPPLAAGELELPLLHAAAAVAVAAASATAASARLLRIVVS
jgi:hypothetical protein